MIDISARHYNYANDDVLSDSLSALIVSAWPLGGVFGPFVEAAISDFWNYSDYTSVIGIIGTVLGAFYMSVNFCIKLPPKIDEAEPLVLDSVI